MSSAILEGRKPARRKRGFWRRRLYACMAALSLIGLLALTGGFLFLLRELQRARVVEREMGVEIGTPAIRAGGAPVEVIAAV